MAVRHGGSRLAEVLRSVPGLKDMAEVQGVNRLEAWLQKDQMAQRWVGRLRKKRSSV